MCGLCYIDHMKTATSIRSTPVQITIDASLLATMTALLEGMLSDDAFGPLTFGETEELLAKLRKAA